MYDKWKKAVVHLECATDSIHFYDRLKLIDELRMQLEEDTISHKEFEEKILKNSRDLRYQGTAIFFKNENRHYLLTARHVLWDELSANREFEEDLNRMPDSNIPFHQYILKSNKERALDKIFNIIFRVPSLDEATTVQKNKQLLMNLGAGSSFSAPYTFSEPNYDLAIISLDSRDQKFTNELLERGFKPITIDDIENEPKKEGNEVFAVGFPGATSLVGQQKLNLADKQWASSYFSLPVLSFGRVSMLHNDLNFFWADMSIYPGNSGGPVIEDNKLVGIVSAQAVIPIESKDKLELTTRIPFGKITKAKYIKELLITQIDKDKTT